MLRPFVYVTWQTAVLETANFENKVPECNLLKLPPSSQPCKLPKQRACECSDIMAHFARVHYSPLCTGTSHTQVCGVCSCSSPLPWYVITPPTTGLAYRFNTGRFWSSKEKTFPFVVAAVKRGDYKKRTRNPCPSPASAPLKTTFFKSTEHSVGVGASFLCKLKVRSSINYIWIQVYWPNQTPVAPDRHKPQESPRDRADRTHSHHTK